MKFEVIEYPGENVKLKAYLYEESEEMPEWKKRPAVVVCPGGGYWMCSDREADPIAMHFSAKGFNTFVFTYSLNKDAAYPRPLVELSRAMKTIRENADKWGIVSDKIAVCGFSAGGHLAASLGTLWNNEEVTEQSGCMNGENQPNALILGYPVASTSWIENNTQLERMVGNRDFDSTIELLQPYKNVGKQTPPSFIFHTYFDNCVPVEDSLLFAQSCAKADVPFDLHVYTNGWHGMSTATAMTSGVDHQLSPWMDTASDWLWRLFGRCDYQSFGTGQDRAHPCERNKL